MSPEPEREVLGLGKGEAAVPTVARGPRDELR
jgi:hypothetical protein